MGTGLFIPLKKADAARRLVYGRLDETPDRAGEIFDYASSKPNFQAWSGAIAKASGGTNLGNVRAMHGLTAAGKLVGVDYDDAGRAIEICAQIIDDNEWKKVESGVYTGFSPGGSYQKRWADGPYTRYTAIPSEISIVDVPCNSGASFAMIKADGVVEIKAFVAPALSRDPLAKVGARNSAADLAKIQQMHDAACALGARCGDDSAGTMVDPDTSRSVADTVPTGFFVSNPTPPSNGGDAGAVVDPDTSRVIADTVPTDFTPAVPEVAVPEEATNFAKSAVPDLMARLDAQSADIKKLLALNAGLQKRMAEIEASPAPGGPRLRDPAAPDAADQEAARRAKRAAEIEKMEAGVDKASAMIRFGFDGK